MTVNTVTGPISADELGFTLMHEHVVTAWDGTFLDSTLRIDWPDIEAKATSNLLEARERGVTTIVDMTTIEMGRNVELLRRVAMTTGVQIICCTGLFAEDYGVPYYYRTLAPDELTKRFVAEVVDGVGTTGIRAGVVKVATGGKHVTELEERIIRAAGTAAAETGVPVLTHTGRGAGGERQIELLLECGVPAGRIVIGHSDVSTDLKYHLRLLRTGVNAGFDRIGLEAFAPDVLRAGCLATLIRAGYTDQLTMSMDSHTCWCGPATGLGPLERDYLHLHDVFFPMLRDAGVDDETIQRIMVANPRRIFGLP